MSTLLKIFTLREILDWKKSTALQSSLNCRNNKMNETIAWRESFFEAATIAKPPPPSTAAPARICRNLAAKLKLLRKSKETRE
nr:hypothetical protein Itr_chr11CG17900 [Ipomoea trifida]GLL39874.1 hypothetical protein Itr_chr11CG17910 [Ipomoea trifida]